MVETKTFDEKYCVDKPCQLCGGAEKVTIFCGGPVTFLCERRYNILQKYWDLKDKYEEFWKKEDIKVNTQIFFRSNFNDDDPVQFIWS